MLCAFSTDEVDGMRLTINSAKTTDFEFRILSEFLLFVGNSMAAAFF